MSYIVAGEEIVMCTDSGSGPNLLTDGAMRKIKKFDHTVLSSSSFPQLFAYAKDKEPLEITSAIRARVYVKDHPEKKVIANFFAVRDAKECIMGEDTAKALNTLLVGNAALRASKANIACISHHHEPNYEPLLAADETITPYPAMPGVKLRLDIDDSIVPKFRNFYIIPQEHFSHAKEELITLLKHGIIERCKFPGSSWVSPGLVIAKKDGKVRFCVDMSAANKAIKRSYSIKMPTLEDMQKAAKGMNRFATLDLKKAFYHIELSDDSKYITTFRTPYGYFRFNRMPFGLNVAPEAFQGFIEEVLKDTDGVKVYIDDILVMAKDDDELQSRLAIVKQRLKANNFQLNSEKEVVGEPEVEFLGFMLSGKGVSITKSRVRAISSMKPPRNFEELRSFLGKVNFLNSFIPRLADISRPLWAAAAHKSSFHWGPEQQNAFAQVKEEIEDSAQRFHFDQLDPTYLVTDASPYAIAAILFQIHTDQSGKKSIQIVEYASRLLNKTQQKYPQFQKELLGIITATKHFRNYLRTTKFTIFTDLKTADTIINKSICGHKREINRHDKWVLELSEYDYKLKHLPGKLNVVDALSRLTEVTTMNENIDDCGDDGKLIDSEHWREYEFPKSKSVASAQNKKCENPKPRKIIRKISDKGFVDDTCIENESYWDKPTRILLSEPCFLCSRDESVRQISFMSCSEVNEIADKDPEMQHLKACIQNNSKLPTKWCKKVKYLWVDDQDLVRCGPLVVLPTALRTKAYQIAHRTHVGAESTYLLLREYVYWPGMDVEIEAQVKNCEVCILTRGKCHAIPMKPVEMPEREFEHVAIDFYEAPKIGAKLISIVDYLTRTLIIEPMKSTSASVVNKKLDDIFKRVGYPSRIRSDNGSPFQSEEFRDWVNLRGMILEHSAPAHPRGNGAIERTMKDVNNVLRFCVLKNIKEWEGVLRDHESLHNAKPSRAMGMSPNIAMENRLKNIGLPIASGQSLKQADLDKLRAFDTQKKLKTKKYRDAVVRARNNMTKVGDLVWVKKEKRDHKLDCEYYADQKFKVLARIGNVVQLEGVLNGHRTTRDLSKCLRCPANIREERRVELWNNIARANTMAEIGVSNDDNDSTSQSTSTTYENISNGMWNVDVGDDGLDVNLEPSDESDAPSSFVFDLDHTDEENSELIDQLQNEFESSENELRNVSANNVIDSPDEIDGIPLIMIPPNSDVAKQIGADEVVEQMIDRQIHSEVRERTRRPAAVKARQNIIDMKAMKVLFIQTLDAQIVHVQ